MNDFADDQQGHDGLPVVSGRLVGWASTKGISPGRRWRELFFYQTSSGRLICHRVERTEHLGEQDEHSVFVVRGTTATVRAGSRDS